LPAGHMINQLAPCETSRRRHAASNLQFNNMTLHSVTVIYSAHYYISGTGGSSIVALLTKSPVYTNSPAALHIFVKLPLLPIRCHRSPSNLRPGKATRLSWPASRHASRLAASLPTFLTPSVTLLLRPNITGDIRRRAVSSSSQSR
jgi:hypothetical protein